jgi:hypothetical protein
MRSHRNEEFRRTESSPSVSVPWLGRGGYFYANGNLNWQSLMKCCWRILCGSKPLIHKPGNPYRRGRNSTVDLLVLPEPF